jgi:ammonia channel protein AmtB
MFTSKMLARVPCFGADGNFGTGTIDDVIDAIPVHGFCGIYGVLMAGFFATPHNYGMAYYSARATECAGVFYGGSGNMLAAQILFIFANLCWTSVCSICVFGGLKFVGLLRVAADVESDGMDVSEHGASGNGNYSIREVEMPSSMNPAQVPVKAPRK